MYISILDLKLINLCLDDAAQDLLRGREVSVVLVEMVENHALSRFVPGLVKPSAPVPGEPFYIFLDNQVQFIDIRVNTRIILMTFVRIRSLPLIRLRPMNRILFDRSVFPILVDGHHSCEVNRAKLDLDLNCWVRLVEFPSRFEDHADDAFELGPFSFAVFEDPGPI